MRHAKPAISILILSIGLGAASAVAMEGPDGCIECHKLLPDELGAPVKSFEKDVHRSRGLSCADCHGGDPQDLETTAMDPSKGYVGAPSRSEIPRFCGRCHSDESYMRRFGTQLPTDQESQYRTSIHGQLLARGDAKVASCVDCHGIHPVLSPSQSDSPVFPANVPKTCARCHADAGYMKDYGIPTNQFAQYQMSAHGLRLLVKRDLGAAACNDCHGNHGAFPPKADSVGAVCGQCHAANQEYFAKSPHRNAFAKLGLPDCAACHGKHEVPPEVPDDALGVGDVAVCVTCHTAESHGYEVAKVLRERLESLKATIATADKVLEAAERAGMEVGSTRYDFQGARQALVQARNVTHAASLEELDKVVREGERIANAAIQAGTEALAENRSRRRLVLIPLAAIGAVMGLLALKLREIDRQNP